MPPTTTIKCQVKSEAKKDMFKPASEVINEVLLKELTDAPCLCLSRVEQLIEPDNSCAHKT